MAETQPDMLGGKAIPASRLRKGRSKAPVTRCGWADTPGSGPAGETCGGCTYLAEYRFKRTYYKCSARAGEHWKGGRETDILLLDAACSKWSGRIKEARPARPTPQPVASPPVATPTPQPTRKPDDERQTSFGW